MNHNDEEISDVIVVLDCKGPGPTAVAVGQLKAAGMEIVEVREDEGVVEGNINACKVHDLKSIPGVSYVRSVFTWVADYPVGDPRDKDGPENIPADED
jgi:hypothetical protein